MTAALKVPRMFPPSNEMRNRNSHHGTGVGAFLRLTLADEEGPVAFAPQQLLGVAALDVAHVPGALVVVGRALVLLQRVGAD